MEYCTSSKDKVMLEFGFILHLILIVSSNTEFNTEHKTRLQLQTAVNVINSVLIQTYQLCLDRLICFNFSFKL